MPFPFQLSFFCPSHSRFSFPLPVLENEFRLTCRCNTNSHIHTHTHQKAANNPCSASTSVPFGVELVKWPKPNPRNPCRYVQNGKLPKELRTPQADIGPQVGWAFIQTNPILPESPESPIHNLPDLDGDYHVHTVAKAASSHGEKPATDLWTHEL